mmetsp:Transcript_22241/g.29367  ORF Transcript_22241/g.29367 Transcript_22241/m.29367 type:complete len:98 (-) Transcript_22241:301-594(-)
MPMEGAKTKHYGTMYPLGDATNILACKERKWRRTFKYALFTILWQQAFLANKTQTCSTSDISKAMFCQKTMAILLASYITFFYSVTTTLLMVHWLHL